MRTLFGHSFQSSKPEPVTDRQRRCLHIKLLVPDSLLTSVSQEVNEKVSLSSLVCLEDTPKRIIRRA
jgi:hypothetical protein